jgi:hypothetical protein
MVSMASPVDAALAALQDYNASMPSLDELATDLIAGRTRRPRLAIRQVSRAAT